MRLEPGQVAVVTGAAGGIGLAMARRFAAEGLKVVLADVEEGALRKAADELAADGAQVLARVVDVSDRDSVIALADTAYETFGAVHVLCNNAGVGSGAEGRMWEHEPNDWKWAFSVNVWGVFHGIQAFVPRMVAGGGPGHVVNTSSGDGGIAPLPTASVYAVTKAAVVTMTESLYAHLKAEGATVGASVLFPGPHMLRTGLWESHRNRPERYAKERPRKAPYRSLDQYEAAMKQAATRCASPRSRRSPSTSSTASAPTASGCSRPANTATGRSAPGRSRCSTGPTPPTWKASSSTEGRLW